MYETEAVSKMVAPGTPRKGKWRGGVLQIWVTRACDKACFGCTQGSQLGGKPGMMTASQFETAVKSLKGYFGVVGVFGGNPAMNPEFPEFCRILQREVPREQRGLWCNNPLGHGKLMRETFNPAVSNLNVHLDKDAYDEFKKDWPECHPVGLLTDSRHSPVHGSMIDLGVPEEKRWELISRCDINQHWSALIGVFRGELRAWFCEVAGSQSMLQQHLPDYPDTGHPVVPGWWRLPMEAFTDQVAHHCHRCLVPLKGFGELAQNTSGRETTTSSYLPVFQPKRKGREVYVAQSVEDLGAPLQLMTNYIGNASAKE